MVKGGNLRSHPLLVIVESVFNKGATMKRILEIRSAEGGDDAKLFAKDLAAAYIKLAGKLG